LTTATREGVPRTVPNVRPDRVDAEQVIELGNGTVRIAVYSIEQFLRNTQVLLVATDPQNLRQCTGSCVDGAKNGDEDLVDCGGQCAPCAVPTLPPVQTTTPLPPLPPGETRAPTPPLAISTVTPAPATAAGATSAPANNQSPMASAPSDVPLIVVAAIAGVLFVALIAVIVCFTVRGKRRQEQQQQQREPHYHTMQQMPAGSRNTGTQESIGAYGSLPPPQSGELGAVVWHDVGSQRPRSRRRRVCGRTGIDCASWVRRRSDRAYELKR
jgi:hypothetical protein